MPIIIPLIELGIFSFPHFSARYKVLLAAQIYDLVLCQYSYASSVANGGFISSLIF